MALSAAQLQSLSSLLDDGLDLPDAAARQAWLAGLPAEHQALAPLLARLLKESAGDATDAWLDQMPALVMAVAGAAAEAQAPEAQAAQRIGPYRLLRVLGEGGMGSVWLAERADGAWQREVALKLPRLAAAPGSFALRFERERNILATLEHPLIARLYDAGTAALPGGGEQPWLAMERVEGLSITAHCDARQLPLRERVTLMLQVLQAVQFAHSRLVVHRDLKPSNILVTADGQVRLLDFGIAKLLDTPDAAAGQATEWAAAPMTPQYASPEQIAGQPIGTASDVYSLGVILFELLTGQRPYRLARDTRGALEQAILEADAPRPSRSGFDAAAAALRGSSPAGLRRLLQGDLDTIVLQALKKSPDLRYPSVAALEEDLRRWLHHEPVRAHPDGWAYRLGKFVQRHTLPLGAAALATLALLVGSGVAWDQARRAQREAQRTQAVQAFLIELFREAEPARAQGREPTVRELLRRGEQRLHAQLGAEPDLQSAIQAALIAIYEELGDGRSGLPLAEAQLALALKQAGAGSLAHGDALLAVGRAQLNLGRNELALATLEQAQQVLLRHADQRADVLLLLEGRRVAALNNLARHDEVVSRLQALIPRLVARYGRNGWQTVSAEVTLATAHAARGEHDTAAQLLKTLAPQVARGWPDQGYGQAALRANVGYVLWQARAWPEAATALQSAIADMDRLLGPNNGPAIDVGRTLGMVHLDAGQYARAAAVLDGNLVRSRSFHGERDSETALNLSFAVMGRLRMRQLGPAEAAARESVQLAERLPGLSASEQRGLRRRLAQTLVMGGKAPEALALLDALLAEETQAQQTQDPRHGATLMIRAGALLALGRPMDAARSAEAAARVQAGLPGNRTARLGLAKARLNQALALLRSGMPDAVPELLAAAEAGLAADLPAGHPDRLLPGVVKVHWLRSQGQAGEADRLLARLQAEHLAASGSPLPDIGLLIT